MKVRRNVLAMLGGAGAAFYASAASGEDVRSIDAFRNRVAQLLKARRPELRTEPIGDAQLKVEQASGAKENAWTIDVTNLYRSYVNGVLGFDAAAAKLAATDPGPPRLERNLLVPLVRPLSYAANFGSPPAHGGPLSRPIAGDLSFYLAVDGADHIAVLTRDEFVKLGIAEDAAWAAAFANVPARAGKLVAEPFDKGVWSVTSPNDLALSLLAVDAFWSNPIVPLKGAPAVAAIQRNLLTVVDTAETSSVAKVREWLRRLTNDPDTMSTSLLIRRNSRWAEL